MQLIGFNSSLYSTIVRCLLVCDILSSCKLVNLLQPTAPCAVLQTSVSEMSASMKQMRSSMEDNEQLKVLMAGFRGSNLDESDFASDGVRMRLVTDLQDSGLTEALPLSYNSDAINR